MTVNATEENEDTFTSLEEEVNQKKKEREAAKAKEAKEKALQQEQLQNSKRQTAHKALDATFAIAQEVKLNMKDNTTLRNAITVLDDYLKHSNYIKATPNVPTKNT